MKTKKFDVVVVGAGPAGSLAAMNTAERGVNTLILEKRKLPRYKLCGGAIPFLVVKDLNIPEEILQREYTILSYFSPPKYERQDRSLKDIKYFGVNRDTFDNYLTKMAVDRGAKLKDRSKVVSIIKKHGQVKGVVTSTGEQYKTDLVIACDGPLSRVSKESGMWAQWLKHKGDKWQDHIVACIGTELRLGKRIIDERFGKSFIFVDG
ncbi:MAG: NAD(P)/FAD-dependent oxidoreductase, partial [Candidatus Hodarchaeales archaeon]